jgi:hypothetical protein
VREDATGVSAGLVVSSAPDGQQRAATLATFNPATPSPLTE